MDSASSRVLMNEYKLRKPLSDHCSESVNRNYPRRQKYREKRRQTKGTVTVCKLEQNIIAT